MGAIGFAAPNNDKSLRSKGGTQVATPEGFLVKASEGPLKDGELDRAATWARDLPTKIGCSCLQGRRADHAQHKQAKHHAVGGEEVEAVGTQVRDKEGIAAKPTTNDVTIPRR